MIQEAQRVLLLPKLKQKIATISANYDILVDAIKQLEGGSVQLFQSLKLVDDVSHKLADAPGERGEAIRNKLISVLSKNESYQILTKVRSTLSDDNNLQQDYDFYTINEMLHLQYAPTTSVDVERGFSYYKFLLGDRRRRFEVENLEMHLTFAVNRAIRKYFF